MPSNSIDQYWSSQFHHTAPNPQHSSEDQYYQEQNAALTYGIDQAQARGLLDVDQAALAKSGSKRTWWDDLIGFEKGSGDMLGPTAQGIVDVLSLGNYAAAAATAATIHDPLVKIGQFKLGFTPSAFLKAFQKRTYYGDIVESFWGGLAMDIAVDPITWLTFGVGSGTKISAMGLEKIGTKALAEGAGKLTMTHHGEQIYQLAARRLRPVVDEALKQENLKLAALGKEQMIHLPPQALARFHEQIGRYMVNNYSTLKNDLMKNMTTWEKFKASISGTQASAIDKALEITTGKTGNVARNTVEDLFQETARFQHVDRGINFTAIHDKLKTIPIINSAMNSVIPQFKRTYNVPEDIVDYHTVVHGTIKQKGAEAVKQLEEKFGHLSSIELETVTKLIEGEDIGQLAPNAAGVMMRTLKDGTHFDQKVLDAAEHAKKMFAEIGENERANGHNIETLKDYVQRVYKTTNIKNFFLGSKKDADGLSNLSRQQGFQMHRSIATIEDAANQLGKEHVETNIAAILLRRQMASIRMIEMEKFYDYVKTTSGITPLLVYRAGNEGHHAASLIKKILKQQRDPKMVFDFDQLYAADTALHKTLGFIDEKGIPKASERNVELLKYLGLDPVERIQNADKYAHLNPTEIAKTFKKPKMTFSVDGKSYNAAQILEEHFSGQLDLLTMISHGKNEPATARDLVHFVREMDKHFRKELGSPITFLFPDLPDSLRESARQTANLGRRVRGSPGSVRTVSQVVDPALVASSKAALDDAEKAVVEAGKTTPVHAARTTEYADKLRLLREAENDLKNKIASAPDKKTLKELKSSLQDTRQRIATTNQEVRMYEAVAGKGAVKKATSANLTAAEAVRAAEKLRDEAKAAYDSAVAGTSKATFSGGVRALTKSTNDMFTELEKILRKDVHSGKSFVPQLPEELILRAKILRMRAGDLTDLAGRSEKQLEQIIGHKEKLGMNGEHLQDVMDALIGHHDLGKLTARDADRLNGFLGAHADEWASTAGKNAHSLFDENAAYLTFGERSKPIFQPQSEAFARTMGNTEAASVAEAKRVAKLQSVTGRISDVNKRIAEAENEIAQLSQAGKLAQSKEEIARFADQIKSKNDQLVNLRKGLTNLEDVKLRISDEIPIPHPQEDLRAFQPIKDFLRRNEDQLDDVAKDFFSRRQGVKRVSHTLKNILPKDIYASAKAALRVFKTEHKDLMKGIEQAGLSVKSAESAVGVAKEEHLQLSRRLAEARKVGSKTVVKLQEQFDKAAAELTTHEMSLKSAQAGLRDAQDSMQKVLAQYMKKGRTEVKLIGDGKFIAPDGKVRDIIIQEGKGGYTHYIAGKWGRQISEALAAEHVTLGRTSASGLTHALAKEIPSNVIGATAGKYLMPESVVRYIQDIVTPQYDKTNPFVMRMLQAYDWVQNAFKVPLLAPWMSTLARNTIGNVSLTYLKTGVAMFDKSTITDFMHIYHYMLTKESKNYKKIFSYVTEDMEKWQETVGKQMVKLHDGTDAISIGELVDEFGRRGVMSSWMNDEIFSFGRLGPMGERIGGAVAGSVIGASAGGPYGALAGVAAGAIVGRETYKMRNLFRFHELASEIPTRMMLAIHEYKKGASLDDVGRTVREFLHDYGDLSVFERRIMRRVFPFYNFMKHSVALSAKQVFKNPGGLILPQKIFHDQNATGGMADMPAMAEDVPDWFHKQLAFMGKDIDHETGEVKSWVVNGFNLPIQEVMQLTDIVGPGGADITQLGGRTSFAVTSPLEYLTNYDTFRGAPIYPNVASGIKQTAYESGNSFKGSPDWMKRLVGYQVGDDGQPRVNPKIAWALGEIPTSRFINVAKKIYEVDEVEAKSLNYNDLSRAVLGASIYRYDEKTQKWFQNKKRLTSMATALSNIQALKSYDFDRSTYSKPTKPKKRSQSSYFK